MWHEIKTWSYLELLSSTKRSKCSSIFYNLSSYQNKRVTVIELRIRQLNAIYLISTFYLTILTGKDWCSHNSVQEWLVGCF